MMILCIEMIRLIIFELILFAEEYSLDINENNLDADTDDTESEKWIYMMIVDGLIAGYVFNLYHSLIDLLLVKFSVAIMDSKLASLMVILCNILLHQAMCIHKSDNHGVQDSTINVQGKILDCIFVNCCFCTLLRSLQILLYS